MSRCFFSCATNVALLSCLQDNVIIYGNSGVGPVSELFHSELERGSWVKLGHGRRGRNSDQCKPQEQWRPMVVSNYIVIMVSIYIGGLRNRYT